MALEQFTPQAQQSLYQPIDVGSSPYYNPQTQQQTSPTVLPTYKAPQFQTGQETFNFDPNQYLPAIQQRAQSIYQPQMAQLEVLRQLQGQQAEQARVVTKEDFAKQMQNEIEAINRRGAFFGGGALTRESDIRTSESRALNEITQNWMANNFSNIAQQAGLSAEQANYIQQQLSGAQGSAYDIFNTERNWFNQMKQQEEDKRRWEKEYKLQKKASKSKKDNGRGGLSKREYAKATGSSSSKKSSKSSSKKSSKSSKKRSA